LSGPFFFFEIFAPELRIQLTIKIAFGIGHGLFVLFVVWFERVRINLDLILIGKQIVDVLDVVVDEIIRPFESI
jgi:hypothetical protein